MIDSHLFTMKVVDGTGLVGIRGGKDIDIERVKRERERERERKRERERERENDSAISGSSGVASNKNID